MNEIKPTDPAFPPVRAEPPNGLTIRAYAAIHLRAADSGIPEVDKLIRSAIRLDLAAHVLGGLAAHGTYTAESAARTADEWATALMRFL